MKAGRIAMLLVASCLAVAAGAVAARAGQEDTDGESNRIVGRVGASGRCRAGGDECRVRHLFAVTVTLYNDSGNEIATHRTRANGRFTFGDVEPGAYEVVARAIAGTRAPEPLEVRVEEDQEGPTRARVVLEDTNGPGVVGQATQAPTCAAQSEGEDCVEPLEEAPIVVKDGEGEVVARTRTGADGYYAFELEPGDYKLVAKRIDGEGLPHPPRPRRFTVARDDRGPHPVDSQYDTGIR